MKLEQYKPKIIFFTTKFWVVTEMLEILYLKNIAVRYDLIVLGLNW